MSVPTHPPPSIERLRELFSYDPENGLFTRIVKRPWSKFPAGSIAGTKHSNGYVYMQVDGRRYLSHRLAWLFVHGKWPPEIDHADQNPANNRIPNLRPVSHALNMLNSRLRVDSRSGVTGVRYLDDCRLNPWQARIKVNGKDISLGYFKEKERAAGVRNAAFEIVAQPAFQAELTKRLLKAAEEYHNVAAA
jgi:HNH endonuclease